jgi:hypothetical protein
MTETFMRLHLIAALVLGLFTGTALAGPAADLLVKHLEAGTLKDGITALEKADDSEARAARGTLKFFTGLERLAQSMHRHGLEASRQRVLGLPILRIPVPPNANPQKLDYPGFRKILATFVEDLAAAEADLAQVGDAPVQLPLDLAKLRLDLDGDGKASDYETLGFMLSGLRGAGMGEAALPMPVRFDTADIYWLRGYGNFLSAFAQLLLAHDFSEMFDKSFHLYFPRAGLPVGERLALDPSLASPMSNGNIADAISMIHLINWEVVEPGRRKDMRLKLKAMAELSRKSWASARAETDDAREWLPNAKQTPALPLGQVDDVAIDSWLDVMAEMEQLLDGKKLLAHWRFNEGLNLRRFIDEGKDFDLVLLIAGPDAVPWLEKGPLTDQVTWSRLQQGFRGNFLGYALWFN